MTEHFWSDGQRTLLLGDALEVLRTLPDGSVHLCVTSPPYWGLRSYQSTDNEQVRVWEDPERECEHEWGQLERGKRKDILPADQTTLEARTGTDARQDGAATNGGQFCTVGHCEHEWGGEEKHGARGDRGTSGTGANKHPALEQDGGQPGSGGGGQFCTRQREACDHEWETERVYTEKSAGRSSSEAFQEPGPENVERLKKARWREQTFCKPCGAWKGALGLEPTIDLYVAHMVSIFREVRRVLRDDGVCIVNMGDGYAGGGGIAGVPEGWASLSTTNRARHPANPPAKNLEATGLKPKDLVGQPFRLALALQADGWWWRSMLPWVKPSSAMPESCTDRPAVSTEYWIMLAKSGRYYWDADAIRKQQSAATLAHAPRPPTSRTATMDVKRDRAMMADRIPTMDTGRGRSYRTGAMLLESLDAEIDVRKQQLAHLESVRNNGGLLLDEGGDPVVVLQNPQPFKGAKYLGDWSRKEWRPIDEERQKKIEVWYIAHPDCTDHAHYHRADKWQKLGYADGREIEARAGDADPKAAKCPCVEVKVDHFAAYSVKLIDPLIRAGCPVSVCAECGAPWVRKTKRTGPTPRELAGARGASGGKGSPEGHNAQGFRHGGHQGEYTPSVETLGFSPTCECETDETELGVVLDLFSGTGTTGVACKLLGLGYVGMDVSRDYNVMASARIHETGKTKEAVAAERAGQTALEF